MNIQDHCFPPHELSPHPQKAGWKTTPWKHTLSDPLPVPWLQPEFLKDGLQWIHILTTIPTIFKNEVQDESSPRTFAEKHAVR